MEDHKYSLDHKMRMTCGSSEAVSLERWEVYSLGSEPSSHDDLQNDMLSHSCERNSSCSTVWDLPSYPLPIRSKCQISLWKLNLNIPCWIDELNQRVRATADAHCLKGVDAFARAVNLLLNLISCFHGPDTTSPSLTVCLFTLQWLFKWKP